MQEIYQFFIEEQWKNISDINISEEFLQSIVKSKIKLVEIEGNSIKFIYVGLITYKDEVMVILPKYFDEKYSDKLKCITKLINVFKRIPKSVVLENKDMIFISKDFNEEYISEIAIADYIIKDFMNNGYYIKQNKINRMNTSGKIDWKKTINEIQPVISNGYPIYNDVYNIDIINNQNNFISRIHKVLVEYSIAKYALILGYNIKGYKLSKVKRNLYGLGSKKYIISKLQNELQSTYNDRNIMLIKAMYNFFNPTRNQFKNNLSLFGTNSFEVIWEFVCGYVFKNQYKELKKLIPNPKWRFCVFGEVSNNKNILKPDILRMHDDKLMILDAKYYSIKLNKKNVSDNPGTYDIVKQYTYEMAFNKKGWSNRIINALIYPKSMDIFCQIFGSVRLDIFDLKPILNIYISPEHLWDMYINGICLGYDQLDQIIDKCSEYYSNLN